MQPTGPYAALPARLLAHTSTPCRRPAAVLPPSVALSLPACRPTGGHPERRQTGQQMQSWGAAADREALPSQKCVTFLKDKTLPTLPWSFLLATEPT